MREMFPLRPFPSSFFFLREIPSFPAFVTTLRNALFNSLLPLCGRCVSNFEALLPPPADILFQLSFISPSYLFISRPCQCSLPLHSLPPLGASPLAEPLSNLHACLCVAAEEFFHSHVFSPRISSFERLLVHLRSAPLFAHVRLSSWVLELGLPKIFPSLPPAILVSRVMVVLSSLLSIPFFSVTPPRKCEKCSLLRHPPSSPQVS